MNSTTPLSALPAAEQQLVDALDSAASTLDTIATADVAAALDRLEKSAGGADRINAALLRLNGVAAGVANLLESAATGVLEDLSSDGRKGCFGTDHRTALTTVPAPIAAAATGQEDLIDLAAPLPAGERIVFHDVTGYSTQPSQDAQQPRQTSQAAEAPALPSTVENASQEHPQATETGIDIPAALASMVSIPEVGRFVSCRHNGPGKFACQSCRASGEAFTPPTLEQAEDLERQVMSAAANRPGPSNRNDRTTSRRKPRGKCKPS